VREEVTLWNAIAGSAQIVTDGVATIPTYTDAAHPGALLVPGGPDDNQYSNDRSWYEVATARPAAGLSRDRRTLTLFTVDVRGGSEGMKVSKVAATLIADYGVWNALNLDGGGSTSLVLADPETNTASIVNTSSDNPSGRSVASSLAVFARRR
jgi:exopolysaccharide biosynthesis protein